MLPDAHGHQQKAIFDFVTALVAVQSCCQAKLARFFGNQEAALKRLARFLRNERLDVRALSFSTARCLVSQLPLVGPVRIAIDWTIEAQQHLLTASLMVGRRGVPLFWRAYRENELKDRRSGYEREFVCTLVREVLFDVSPRRLIMTADRACADVEMFDVLSDLGVSFVIRSKGSVKVLRRAAGGANSTPCACTGTPDGALWVGSSIARVIRVASMWRSVVRVTGRGAGAFGQ